MTDTFNRGLIASAAIGSVVMALLMSGGASQAAPLYHEGINADGTVVCDGRAVGRDPSPFIQNSMLRDCGRAANGGDGSN
jgi:hypothetical protein